MRIRFGLVSNSSSTSFIVLIPEALQLTDDEIKEPLYQEEIDWDKLHTFLDTEDEEEATAYAVNVIREALGELEGGGEVYEDWSKNETALGSGRLKTLSSIAQNKGLVIQAVDVSSEQGSILGVTEDTVLEILNKYKANSSPGGICR